MTRQAHIIDALNQYWRPAYLDAADASEKSACRTLLTGFEGFSDSLCFLLPLGFGVGTTLFGFAFLSADAVGKGIGGVLILLGLLSLAAFTGYYTPLSAITSVTGWIYSNLYGIAQTAVRRAIAVSLWRECGGRY